MAVAAAAAATAAAAAAEMKYMTVRAQAWCYRTSYCSRERNRRRIPQLYCVTTSFTFYRAWSSQAASERMAVVRAVLGRQGLGSRAQHFARVSVRTRCHAEVRLGYFWGAFCNLRARRFHYAAMRAPQQR